MIEIARRLAPAAGAASVAAYPSVLRNTHWLQGDLTSGLPAGTWDLVVCSYALNELGEAQRAELIRQAWARCAKLLVVVEPGTMAGFANVLAVRTRLLAAGAYLAAPCPNSLACPMAGGGDWCHFAARIERTASHRRLKEATLGHEDEKFSYIAFTRTALEDESPSPRSRIVRHPRIFSGYAQLTLCREGEIAATTVTRSHKEDWRRLKRLGWGDRW
jgi:ribosomal protein RSM22 (predicted rRNA methylase)